MNRKSKYDSKFIRKTIRFTPAEFEKIETQRAKTNLSFSEYVRKSSSSRKISSKTDEELIYQINKIGTNLNQIARAVNQEEKIAVLTELVEIEKALKGLL